MTCFNTILSIDILSIDINKVISVCPGDQRKTNTQTFQGDYGFNQLWIENIHTQNPICMECVQIFSSHSLKDANVCIYHLHGIGCLGSS